MRILHVITTLDVGGAEMHLLAQVRGQCARGHHVELAYLKGQGSLAQDFLDAGARWVGPVGQGPGLLLKLIPRMRAAELVHTHLLKADMAGALCALLAGRRKRLVAGKHNDEQVLRRPWVGRVHGLLGRLPRLTIPLSDHVARFVAEHGRVPLERQRRIYYGLDPAPHQAALARAPEVRPRLRAELGLEPEAVVFVCVARFAPQKAHDVLLRAFARARAEAAAEDPPLRLVLVGDDPFGDGRQRAEAVAAELELGSAVLFTGIRRDVPDLLAMSDVFTMASLWEGLGLVFLEAMATRLPVLSTRVSAIPEVVREGETGLLVEAAQEAPLGEAMLRLARDPELRERLGAAGEARVLEQFGLERMVEETLAAYADVVGG